MKNITEPIFFDNCFSEDEINSILDLQNKFELKSSQITSQKDLENYRVSDNFWIPKEVDYKWIYDKLTYYIRIANEKYNFDLSLIKDDIQFSVYSYKDQGHYEWHDDILVDDIETMRKLSISVQLSDENDYEGGNLELIVPPNTIIAPKKKGTIIVFPSFLVHRVTPVTKGKRISLVLWIDGPHFR